MKKIFNCIILFFQKLFGEKSSLKKDENKPNDVQNYIMKDFDNELIVMILRFREENHLKPIFNNQELANVSYSHSMYMALKNEASHDFAVERQKMFPQYRVAEIVASGYQKPSSVLAAWIKSEPHREKILKNIWKYMAITSATSHDGKIYVTCMFMG